MSPVLPVPPKKRRSPSGFWLILGIGAGVAIGLALNSLLLGMLIGIGLMLAVGSGVAQFKRDVENQKDRMHGRR